MKKYSNLFKRSQALILAVAMMLTVICPALCLNISADEKPTVSKTEGEIVASNYDLTDAEKKLLSSGLLAGGTVEYTVPADEDDLVSVDIDTKTISANTYAEWVPTKAVIVAGGEEQETITLNDGRGVYTYAGDAFSVKVTYQLTAEVDAKTQTTLLSTPAWLKQGIANLDAVANESGKLSILEQAMPELVKLANDGIQTSLATVKLNEAASAAINDWAAQMSANAGKMNLSALIEEYQSGSAVAFLLTKGETVLEEVETFNEQVVSVAQAMDTIVSKVDLLLEVGVLDENTANQIQILARTVNDLKGVYAAIPSADWTAAKKGTALVQPDLTDEQYDALDTMVIALVTTTSVPAEDELKNPLLVDTTTVQCNMSMFDVTIKAILTLADGTPYETTPVKVTFADGTDYETMYSAAEEIANNAMATWEALGLCDSEHFSYAIKNIPEILTEDVEVTIVVTPDQYEVYFLYDSASEYYPYGSKITLEKYNVEGMAYDYYVNGEYVPEGTTIVVQDSLKIDRVIGKAYSQTNFYQVVTDCFYTTDSKGAAILTSGALLGNEPINVRYPDNNNGTVTLQENVLTAQSYPASYQNLTWVPYSYTVIGDGVDVTRSFDGANQVTITEEDYDRVEVRYQLVLTNFSDSQIADVLGLPAQLAADANAQKNALNKLAGNRDQFAQLDRTKLGALNGVIDVTDLNDDPAVNEAIKAEFKSIVSAIITNCLNGSTLRIVTMLEAYAESGLAYYYQNSDAVIKEINTLSGCLSAMLETPEKKAAVEALVVAAGYPEYAEKIEKLEGAMAEVQEALTAPHSAIDLTSANLGKLVAALEMTGGVTTPETGALYMISGAISLNALSKATVSVVINGVTYPVITKVKGEQLTASEIEGIVEFVDAKVAELGFSDKYYTHNYDATALSAVLTGKTVGELEDMVAELTYTWTAKTFTVVVGGEEQTITVDDLTIDLKPSTTTGTRYEYVIDGVVKPVIYATTYTFTLEQIDRLFVDGKYTVVLNKVDMAAETLENMVADLNASASGAFKFVLVENNGAYSIVMRVNTSDTNSLTSALKSVAMSLVNSGYSYIGVDGNGFIYLDETNTMKISLQAIVDALMNSGFGMDSLVNVMDSNGVINQFQLEGNAKSGRAVDNLGGLLMQTTMQLGNTAEDAQNVSFYLTLNNSSPALLKVRNLLAGRVGNYVDANFVDGAAHLSLNMPKKAYEAYLAVLLVTDNVDFSSVNAMNSQIAIGFAKDMVAPLFTGNVSTTTLMNTLNKFGYNLNLAGYENLWNQFCKIYSDLEFSYSETDIKSGMISGNIGISGIIDRMNLGELGKMIVEYETGIDFNIKLTIENIGTEYDALYIDVKASGVVNKAGLTTNLPEKVSQLSGGSVIVLLNDVDGDLNFSKTSVLNLNGFDVNGNISSANNLFIVDTALDQIGEVTGTVSGNVTVIGGKYASDVTAFIRAGYSQKNGVVSNDYFNIVKDPATGDINIELDAGVLAINQMPNMTAMLIDVATELICNGYTTNSLYLDGNMVYNVSLVDLVGIYADTQTLDNLVNQVVEMFDSAQLANIINAILADVTDFAALEDAVLAGTPLMSYEMQTGAWSVELTHVTEGDYLSANLTSANTKTVNLNVVVTGTEQNKQNLADILAVLAEVIDADLAVDMADGFSVVNNKNFVLDWKASANVAIDLTNPDYAILIAVIVADGIGADANSELVDAIEEYYMTSSLDALKVAFEKLTVNQIVTALKNVNRGDNFRDMLDNLGIIAIGEDKFENIIRVEGLFDRFVKAAGAILRRLNITGGSRTMGSFKKGENLYGGTKQNIERSFTRDLFRGYSVTMDFTITKASVTLKMFDNTPAFTDGTGTPTIQTSDKLAGWQVDTENKLIYLDTVVNGITADELASILNFSATNYDTIEFEIENKFGMVFNGAKLVATASKASGLSDTVEYTIIVLGDIDANGRVTTGDALMISEAMVGNADPLTELQMMAADLNRNRRVDVGDTALIAQKYVDWESYFSRLED